MALIPWPPPSAPFAGPSSRSPATKLTATRHRARSKTGGQDGQSPQYVTDAFTRFMCATLKGHACMPRRAAQSSSNRRPLPCFGYPKSRSRIDWGHQAPKSRSERFRKGTTMLRRQGAGRPGSYEFCPGHHQAARSAQGAALPGFDRGIVPPRDPCGAARGRHPELGRRGRAVLRLPCASGGGLSGPGPHSCLARGGGEAG